MSYDEFPGEFQQIRHFIEAEDFQAAEALLKEIVRKRPDFQQAQLDLERVQGKAGSISNYEFRIKAFLDDGDIEQARRILAEALQKFPRAPRVARLNMLFMQKAGPGAQVAASPASSSGDAHGGGGNDAFNLDQSLDTVLGAPPPDVVEMLKKIGVAMPAGGGAAGGRPPGAASSGSGQQLPSAAGPDPFRRKAEPAPPPQPKQKLVELPPQAPKPAPTPQQPAARDTRMVGRSDGMPQGTARVPNSPAPQGTGQLPPRPPEPNRRVTTSAHFPTSASPGGRPTSGVPASPAGAQPRPNNTTQIKTTLTVNLPADLKTWLVAQAAREGLSPSALMRRLARDYRRHRELKDGQGG